MKNGMARISGLNICTYVQPGGVIVTKIFKSCSIHQTLRKNLQAPVSLPQIGEAAFSCTSGERLG